MAWPTPGPSPLTRLKTPAGTPAASMTSANTTPLKGAISLGFSTMVQPAASAGRTFSVIWLTGQFQGVMNPHTPIGSRRISVAPRCSSNSKFSSKRRAVLAMTTPMAACAFVERPFGAPISTVIAAAMSL